MVRYRSVLHRKMTISHRKSMTKGNSDNGGIMTKVELFNGVLKATKKRTMIFVFIIALVLALYSLKFNYVQSVIYAIVLTFATQTGSARAIARRAYKKAENMVCDELYLAYDNRFSFKVKTYLISVEGDIISRINCFKKDDKEVLAEISNTDLDANTITLKDKQYILLKMK